MLAYVRIYRPWTYGTTLFVTRFIIINAFKQKPDSCLFGNTYGVEDYRSRQKSAAGHVLNKSATFI